MNIGSPLFMSPEGILQGYYGPKTDVWAFGIFLYQLFHGIHIFEHCKSEESLVRSVSKPLERNCINAQLTNDLKDLILNCLDIKETTRPSFEEIAEMPFIRNLQNTSNNICLVESHVE